MLMVCYMKVIKKKDAVQVIDLFAGQARLAKLAAALGYVAVALDQAYDKDADNVKFSNSMDLCTSAGFVLLDVLRCFLLP